MEDTQAHPDLNYNKIDLLQKNVTRYPTLDFTIEEEDILKQELDTGALDDVGLTGGGYICHGSTYATDHGWVFIKVNTKPLARTMFDGEYASLMALHNTDIVTVPRPIKVIDRPSGGAMLVMEYMDLSRELNKHSSTLGDQLARMHLQNEDIRQKSMKEEKSIHKDGREIKYVDKFGFDINTCCGYLEMDNSWCDDWQTFYAKKIEKQIDRIEQNYGDRQARELWNKVLNKLPVFFKGLDIRPALLHGDLWVGNIAENDDGPLLYDPGSFYGHSEFDMAVSHLFDGFSSSFMNAYHKLIPEEPGFSNRLELYKLFVNLNRWNHFGDAHRSDSISALETCVRLSYKDRYHRTQRNTSL